MGFFEKLKAGLSKTKTAFVGAMNDLFRRHGRIDDALYDELEELLYTADVGVETTEYILDTLQQRVHEKKATEAAQCREILIEILCELVGQAEPLHLETTPSVILVIGVNGVGKTTSIAKIAKQLKESGKKVLLAAADTFRAAAIDQIAIWADRVGVGLIRHEEGSDPASVVYDAAIAAKNQHADVLIVDTAGRLHNKKNLMDELAKIDRVLARELPGADRETLLVLDATTGQNAVIQAKAFKEAAKLTGLILTKMDGTAKGGIVFSIRRELGIPVKFIGVGEQAEDLQPFSAQDFVKALFEGEHAAAKEEGETD